MKRFINNEEVLISDKGTLKKIDVISVITVGVSSAMIIILCYLGIMALI